MFTVVPLPAPTCSKMGADAEPGCKQSQQGPQQVLCTTVIPDGVGSVPAFICHATGALALEEQRSPGIPNASSNGACTTRTECIRHRIHLDGNIIQFQLDQFCPKHPVLLYWSDMCQESDAFNSRVSTVSLNAICKMPDRTVLWRNTSNLP